MNKRARLFAAIELPPELKQALAHVLDGLRAALPRGSVRWVRPESIHLTLKFYGEVVMDRAPGIEAELSQAAAGAQPFRLGIEGMGVFPSPLRPQVLWVGLTGELEPLLQLQRTVEAASERLGFSPERREFQPHLTVGRVNRKVRPGDMQRLIDYVQQARVEPLGEYQVETLSLMRSDLRPDGAAYTTLFVAPLGRRADGA